MVEVTLASQRVYEGRVLNLRVDEVRLPNGLTRKREIVEHGGAVAIVAIDDERRVLLVRQYRGPVEREMLEIPAGGIESGEDPDAAAVRELREETGCTADCVERLIGFYSAPGFCTEYLHVYLATGLRAGSTALEEDESIELARVPLAEVGAMIARGEIADAKSIVGLLTYLAQHR